jgi:tetratricopeptide (TPR) repeat protein
VSADARGYLLDVTQELDFTRALPAADSSQSTAALRSSLVDALARKPIDVNSVLQIGTAALLSGRMPLASAAFNAASDAAPSDWRGPYFAGLTAQASGDSAQAQTLFNTALGRQPRAEAYTSLAAVALDAGDAATAAVDARRAVSINPSYEPGRFVAGMLDLIQQDVRGAQSNLAAAQALGGAPSRTAYFLDALHDIVGSAGGAGG